MLRYLGFVLVCISTVGMGAAFFLATTHWIDVSMLEHYNPGKPSLVLDHQGNEWFKFQLDKRDPVKLAVVPSQVINAFLAAEDWHFFSHCGLSFKGIIRSIAKNIYHGKRVQGASTITQQLVKLLYFDTHKTFSRKLKEQLYTLIIEQQFTKEQILEIYLNHIYFGCGIYGIEAAAQRFWGISATQLSVAQAASLASIVKNPGQYCPLLYPLSHERRRNVVLHSMYKRTFITRDAYQSACDEPLALIEEDEPGVGQHVRELLRVKLEQMVGKKQLYSGGLLIHTTIDQTMQRVAQREFEAQCAALSAEFGKSLDGALISLDVQTGGIRALVGGKNFAQSKFNRAVQARRQLGSVFKPVVYAAAMQDGMSFADVELDEPFEMAQPGGAVWAPKNFNRRFNGPITRAYALSHSNNIVTIKTLLDTGVHAVIALAKKCRIAGPFHPYPSLALGCVDGTLQETAGMFNTFANDGVYVAPYVIQWIKDQWGAKIYRASHTKERVMSSAVCGKVAKVLSLGVQRARSWFPNWIDAEAISKTGTTNDSRTSWYIGSTPSFTTAIYIGCDNNEPIGKDVYPIKTGFPIWLALNREIPSSMKTFSYDPSLQSVVINERTGAMVARNHKEAVEIFV